MSRFQAAAAKTMRARRARFCRQAVLWTLLALFAFNQPASSLALDKRIIHVPADYPTIGAALERAGDHAIVEVAGGLYRESLNITRPLIIRGKRGHTVLLVGDVERPVITIADTADVQIANLVISGGKFGIYITRSQDVRVRDNLISDSRLAGIKVRLAAADILHNTIRAAIAPYGRGIHVTNTTQWPASRIIGNTVSHNAHSGIATNMTGQIYIEDNIVSDNLKHGIMIDEMSHALVADNIVDSNAETGIYVFDMSMASICGNVVMNTAAGGEGARFGNGIMIDFHSLAEARDNIVTGNVNRGIQSLFDSRVYASANDLRGNGADELPRYTKVADDKDCEVP